MMAELSRCTPRFALLALLSLAATPAPQEPRIAIDYPEEGSVFPPDFASPTFLWRDSQASATAWEIEIAFSDGAPAMRLTARGEPPSIGEIDPLCIAESNQLPRLTPEQAAAHTWKPLPAAWSAIKAHSAGHPATVTITEPDGARAHVHISTSPDPVGAPIFYRDVPLMPSEVEKGVIKPSVPSAVPLVGWRMPETFGSGVAWIDFDNDGFPDLFFANGADLAHDRPCPGNVLYRNLGNGKFEDVIRKAGVAGNGMFATGVTVGDYDNDGFLDIFVTGYNSRQLFHNNGDGTFTDVTAKAGVAGGGWSSSAAWVDYDRDGYLDLFVVRYLDYDVKHAPYCGYKQEGYRMYCDPQQFDGVPAQLFHNNHDGTFTDVSVKAGIANRAGKGLGVAVGDIDLDGWPDIFVTNDGVRSFPYHNKGDGTFQDVTYTAGTGFDMNGKTMAGMGTEIAGFDGDGLPDIFLTAFSREYNTLYRNLGKLQFEDVTLKAGLQSGFLTLAFGTKLFDFDNDGLLDIFCTNCHVTDNVELYDPQLSYRQSGLLYQNAGGGRFKDVSAESGPAFRIKHVGRGAAVADFDNDGDLDIVIADCGGPALRYRNDGGNRNHWLAIKARGRESNRFGLGSKVRITAGGDAASRDQPLRQLPEHQQHAAVCRTRQGNRCPAPGDRVAQGQEAGARGRPRRPGPEPG